jgi:hypothetical protein
MTYTINDKPIKNLFEDVWTEGYYISLYGEIDGTLTYTRPYDDNSERKHTAEFIPAAWATRPHGNAPTGTYYGKYRISLPNGERANLRLYI